MSRIVLIGDAGALVDGKAPVMQAVRDMVPLDEKTTVVYLGDNLYRRGLPDEQAPIYTGLRSVLDSQIALVEGTGARGYMIPGNHDWHNGGPDGYEYVVRQQQYVDAVAKNMVYYPKDGCPGPVQVNVGDDIVIIMMDTQWWLHTGDKPGIESDCPAKTKAEVLSEIEDILANNPKKLVLFACHHPFRSNGYHGGYFSLLQHLFPFRDLNKNLWIPLPLLGSIYPISRSVFGSPQDLKHPTYANMADTIQAVVKRHLNVIFVAGHEHNLQYFPDSNHHYIVSGSGCKSGRVEDNRKSEFVTGDRGFAVLEVSKNKNVRLKFYTTKPDETAEVFSKNIFNFSHPSTIEDTIPATEPAYIYKDSALVKASTQYDEASKLKRRVMGENYRAEWSLPVKMKVFNINKEKGGLKIVSFGGGRQTRTLTLVDKQGAEWKLRTIDKDPERLIPNELRGSLAHPVVQDLVSASYPYAPYITTELSETVNVPHTYPEFFFVPDDPSLGFYQELFANKVCMLERKSPLSPKINTRSTAKLLNKMIEDNDHVVDQHAVLNARLLDILIADWDRHMDQWRWEVGDTGKGKIYYPIPRDRDEAFFYSDGLLIKYLSRNKIPLLKGFQHKIPRINWLGYIARDFDRLFLNGLDQQDWETAIKDFQVKLTDTAIEQAVKNLPPEVYQLSGPVIAEKLKSRRNLLMKEGIEYFDFISHYVNVLGSNEQEYFKVSQKGKNVLVQTFARDDERDTTFLIYAREFEPDHTREIRLFGFNENDIFEIEESVNSKIKVRIVGGRGVDTFNIKGDVRNFLYDLTTEENVTLASNRTRNRMSSSPDVNYFDYGEFKYQEKRRLPTINAGFNTEDGPMLGLGFWLRDYGFRKEPYAAENKFTTLYSFLGKAYRMRYNGSFTDALYKTDIVINAQFVNPTLNNFFGLGNETQKLPDIDRSFYRVRYKFISGDFQFRKNYFGKVRMSLGPSFAYYWIQPEDNKDRILQTPELVGMNYQDVYTRKTYLGGKFNINVNNLNNDVFPTRGVNWENEFLYLNGLNGSSTPISRFQSDMAVHASLRDPAKLVAVLRLGGGHIFSKSYEYFQALNLGTNNYLRGFRKNRFSGSSMAYTSLELWYKIKDLQSYVVPGSFGIVGFHDIGRVWTRNQVSKKWHRGYGGGLYYIPFNLVIISATVAFSEEETLFNFTIGTKLNLTF